MRERKVVKRWIPATGVTVIPRHREHHGGMGLLNQTVHARNQGKAAIEQLPEAQREYLFATVKDPTLGGRGQPQLDPLYQRAARELATLSAADRGHLYRTLCEPAKASSAPARSQRMQRSQSAEPYTRGPDPYATGPRTEKGCNFIGGQAVASHGVARTPYGGFLQDPRLTGLDPLPRLSPKVMPASRILPECADPPFSESIRPLAGFRKPDRHGFSRTQNGGYYHCWNQSGRMVV